MTRFSGLVPWLEPAAEWLYQVAAYNGLRPRITSVYRTHTQQAYLRQRYERGLSDLYAAPVGQSYHEYGRAFDMVTDNPSALGALWNRIGGTWTAGDPVHFQA